MADFPETDWKYLSRLRPELLEELSRRINDELRALLQTPGISQNDRRRMIYDLIHEMEHLENLTEESRCRVRRIG